MLDSVNCPIDSFSLEEAIFYKNKDILKRIRNKGVEWTENCSETAVGTGDLEILKFIISYGCPVDNLTLFSAANSGHLHIITYLHEIINIELSDEILSAALSSGNASRNAASS